MSASIVKTEYGMEKAQDLWCIFKKEERRVYWLDIDKNWTFQKSKRAGVKSMDTAQKILMKMMEKRYESK
jgi:hypothetical protein